MSTVIRNQRQIQMLQPKAKKYAIRTACPGLSVLTSPSGVQVFRFKERVIGSCAVMTLAQAIKWVRQQSQPAATAPKPKKRRSPTLPRRPQQQNQAAITDAAAFAGLLHRCEKAPGRQTVRLGLSLMSHLFLRSNELLKLEWRFLDTRTNTLKLPAGYTKNGILRDIPLSDPVRSIIKTLYQIKTLNPDCPYLLSINGKTPLSDTALRNQLGRCLNVAGEHSLHGFRASARTLIRDELNFPRDVIEHQLDHVPADNNGTAYNRTDLQKQRRDMMAAWSAWIEDAINQGPLETNELTDAVMEEWS